MITWSSTLIRLAPLFASARPSSVPLNRSNPDVELWAAAGLAAGLAAVSLNPDTCIQLRLHPKTAT